MWGPEGPQFECDSGVPSGNLEFSLGSDSDLLGDLRQDLSSLSLFVDL